MAKPPTFDDHVKRIQRAAQALGNECLENPDDDWPPLLYLADPDGSNRCVEMSATTDQQLQHLPALVGELVRRHRPAFAALLLTCYLAKVAVRDGDRDPVGTAHRVARREAEAGRPGVEVLILTACDGKRTAVYSAAVLRYPSLPPQLGAWQDRTGGLLGGPLVEALAAAFAGRPEAAGPDCVLCGRPGLAPVDRNNPWPLADEGVCCPECDRTKVTPARLLRLLAGDN